MAESRNLNHWHSYNDLAWTERILCPPEESGEEPERIASLLERRSDKRLNTVLHLGSGAGSYDYWLKKQYEITGVDISNGMLREAQKLNPEIRYLKGDMRHIRLDRIYDAVIVPDAVDYMRTESDLAALFSVASSHLDSGGLFLVVANTSEEFRKNNFVYTGEAGDVHITVFENNHILPGENAGYEAILCYLIRQRGELSIHSERHLLGLFNRESWISRLRSAGFSVSEDRLDDAYDHYLMTESTYLQTVFICIKQ